jgi:hypothetical protein
MNGRSCWVPITSDLAVAGFAVDHTKRLPASRADVVIDDVAYRADYMPCHWYAGGYLTAPGVLRTWIHFFTTATILEQPCMPRISDILACAQTGMSRITPAQTRTID